MNGLALTEIAALGAPVAAAPVNGYRILLIEDKPGEVEVARSWLAATPGLPLLLEVAVSMVQAENCLATVAFDAILTDLELPDARGLAMLRQLRQMAGELPIVVLTGSDDEQLAMDCIDAGAQDYLPKAEVRSRNLRRALGYAITRIRDAQVRHLQDTLSRYRTLSTASQGTAVTAALGRSRGPPPRSPSSVTMISIVACGASSRSVSRER